MKNGPHTHRCDMCLEIFDCPRLTHCTLEDDGRREIFCNSQECFEKYERSQV